MAELNGQVAELQKAKYKWKTDVIEIESGEQRKAEADKTEHNKRQRFVMNKQLLIANC